MYSLFAVRFNSLRKSKGLSQSGIAKELNVSKGSISVWERGIRIPRYSEVIKVAKYFDVSQAYLLGIDEVSMTANESPLTELVHVIPSLSPRSQEMARDFLGYLLELEGFMVDDVPSKRK